MRPSSDPPGGLSLPLFGQPAGMDSWWTQEQLDYAQGVATPAAVREIEQGLRDAFKSASSKHVGFDFKGGVEAPDVPAPLTEPDAADDMVIVASLCHSYEPVKVPEAASGRITASCAIKPSPSDPRQSKQRSHEAGAYGRFRPEVVRPSGRRAAVNG